MGKTKLYIVPEKSRQETVFTLVAETGEGLASHFCSNGNFAMGDLVQNRPERQKEYNERFGEYEVMFLEDDPEITEDELIRRNKEWAKTNLEEQDES